MAAPANKGKPLESETARTVARNTVADADAADADADAARTRSGRKSADLVRSMIHWEKVAEKLECHCDRCRALGEQENAVPDDDGVKLH